MKSFWLLNIYWVTELIEFSENHLEKFELWYKQHAGRMQGKEVLLNTQLEKENVINPGIVVGFWTHRNTQ